MRIFWKGSCKEQSGEVIEVQEGEKYTCYLVKLDNGKNVLVGDRTITRKED